MHIYYLPCQDRVKLICFLQMIFSAQHAAARWYDQREAVFVEFCVEDSQNVQVKFDTFKLDFR